MLHRAKRNPGQFMMRLKVPNGIVNSDQMRFYADSVEKYGPEKGVVDITTRANIQLRGVKIEDAPTIIDGLHSRNQTSFQSALDSVRNMVGSPLAGIDDKELVDTRELCNALNDLVSLDPVTGTRGNPQWGNLPRKFNIAVSGSRDDFAHTHINDIGLQPVPHAETGEMGFNVVLGGYMSIKRVAHSIDSNMWIPADRNSVFTLSEAILRIFRDESERKNRQKARLMWLIEKYGVEDFKTAVVNEIESYERGVRVEDAQPAPTEPFERRELLGVHDQPQEGKARVGISVPVGRLSVQECRDLADLADKYSGGEIRLTVEQSVILPNVDKDKVDDLLKEPAVGDDRRLEINPGLIEGNVVSVRFHSVDSTIFPVFFSHLNTDVILNFGSALAPSSAVWLWWRPSPMPKLWPRSSKSWLLWTAPFVFTGRGARTPVGRYKLLILASWELRPKRKWTARRWLSPAAKFLLEARSEKNHTCLLNHTRKVSLWKKKI